MIHKLKITSWKHLGVRGATVCLVGSCYLQANVQKIDTIYLDILKDKLVYLLT